MLVSVMALKRHPVGGRPKSDEVRVAFQINLLEDEKRLLRRAMRLEGIHISLSRWIITAALEKARRGTS